MKTCTYDPLEGFSKVSSRLGMCAETHVWMLPKQMAQQRVCSS